MPELRELPELHVAYVTEFGSFDDVVPRGFDRLFTWLRQNGVEPIGNSFAIFYDYATETRRKNERCDLCVHVGPHVEGSGDVRTREVGGWTVASIGYHGRESREQAYNDVYKWLRAEGYEDADAPLEFFLSRLGEELRAEIAVPVRKAKKAGRKTSAVKRARGAAAKKPTRRTKAQAPVTE